MDTDKKQYDKQKYNRTYYTKSNEAIKLQHKKYYTENKQTILNKCKEYRTLNANKIYHRYSCRCGGSYSKNNYSRHTKSIIHKAFINTD